MKDDRNRTAEITAGFCLAFEALVVISLGIGWFQEAGSGLIRPLQIIFYIGYLGMGIAFLVLLFLVAFRLFGMMAEALNRNEITKKRELFTDRKRRFPVFRVTLAMVLFILLYFIAELLMRAGQ